MDLLDQLDNSSKEESVFVLSTSLFTLTDDLWLSTDIGS